MLEGILIKRNSYKVSILLVINLLIKKIIILRHFLIFRSQLVTNKAPAVTPIAPISHFEVRRAIKY